MAREKPALAAQLDSIRQERRYSVRDLADLAHINYTYVSKILAGRHIPSPVTLEKLASALQADIVPLLQLYEELPRQMLTRLVTERSSVAHRASRGTRSGSDDDRLAVANLPQPIVQALRAISKDGKGTPGISDILQSIASIESPARRDELIDAIAGLVKLYVPREGEAQ